MAQVGDADADRAREAFAGVAVAYRRPVEAYLRLRWHTPADEAEELAQAFFARAFEKRYFAAYCPGRARFRTFLRVCLDRFVVNERKAAGRLKRGGETDVLSLDAVTAEGGAAYEPVAGDPDPETVFAREWARSLLGDAIETVKAAYDASGRSRLFEVFERYELAPSAGPDPTYAELAAAFELTVAQVTNALAAVRRDVRDAVLARLRTLCATEAEFAAEADELLGRRRRDVAR